MPLVLAENEMSESGISYADKTGISYEYPSRYRNLIRSGERFIYYRGRKTLKGTRSPQVYFGCGIIGDLTPGPEQSSRWTCQVLDYRAFDPPIFFKIGENEYLEPGGNRRGYFQTGVRRISEDVFNNILQRGDLPKKSVVAENMVATGYANAETRMLVDLFAVRHALLEIQKEFPLSTAIVMPPNNPGFDIRLRDAPVQFVEIKGTQSPVPGFFITSGELKFSAENSNSYTLLVIYNIDLKGSTYKTYWYQGDVNKAPFSIIPTQFRAVSPIIPMQ